MQTGKKRELPKRTRYYQGNIDLDLITKNEPYENFKTSYVIFICTFDPFADGRHIYTFKNVCMENKELLLGDETIKIFLNTRGKKNNIDYDLEEFLKYVENTTDGFVENTKSDFVKTIHKNVKQIKASKDLEVEYITLMQREREIMEEAREEMLFQLFVSGVINSEIILKELNITDYEFEQLLKKYK